MKDIKILIIDDHTLVRQGMQMILEQESDLTVVGDVSHLFAALEILRREMVDLIIMDYSLENETGDENSKRILAEFPQVRILAVSSFSDASVVRAMLEAGATSYLIKGGSKEDLLMAARATAEGQTFISGKVSRSLLLPSSAPVELTNREKEVLRLITQEHTTKQIADTLNISPKTVEKHRLNLMQKTGAKNVVGLVRYALKSGIAD